MEQSTTNVQTSLSISKNETRDAIDTAQENMQRSQKLTQDKTYEQNDYRAQFKYSSIVESKEEVSSGDDIFVIFVNKIIDQHIRPTESGDGEKWSSKLEGISAIVEIEECQEEIIKGPSITEKIKAEDDEVKRRIRELMRRKPVGNKKQKQEGYELDPNKDKGFLLAKKMSEMKKERERRHVQYMKQIQAQRLEEQNFSLLSGGVIDDSSGRKIQTSRMMSDRYSRGSRRKLSNLPPINKSTIHIENFNMDQGNPSGEDQSRNVSQFYSSTIEPQSERKVSNSRKRDMQRQIEILRKSQKATVKYEEKKFVSNIVSEMVCQAVKIVERKKEFFNKVPPKPVAQIIRNYKDKSGKVNWIPGSKPEKFRINIHLPAIKTKQMPKNGQGDFGESSLSKMSNSRMGLSRVSHSFDITLKNGRAEIRQAQINNFTTKKTNISKNATQKSQQDDERSDLDSDSKQQRKVSQSSSSDFSKRNSSQSSSQKRKNQEPEDVSSDSSDQGSSSEQQEGSESSQPSVNQENPASVESDSQAEGKLDPNLVIDLMDANNPSNPQNV